MLQYDIEVKVKNSMRPCMQILYKESKNMKVSICCITYNHGKYIRKAIDSFLVQKRNFDIEILINDDASTDDTADIIREYERQNMFAILCSNPQIKNNITDIAQAQNFETPSLQA